MVFPAPGVKRAGDGPLVLAGDIGGTKTNLALFEGREGSLRLAAEATYPSRQYKGLEPLVKRFMDRHRVRVVGGTFGVAGPVSAGEVKTTNLPWIVRSRSLARVLNLPRVALINDLVANAWGVASLGAQDVEVLNKGSARPTGNRAILAAGTGLGEVHLTWDGTEYRPSPSEGGHVDFAPRNKREARLLAFLNTKYKRVSYERVLSGPGLHNIYRFLRDGEGLEEPAWLAKRIQGTDSSAVISEAGLARRSKLCMDALELFVEIYGAQAGNVALATWATGGLYIGGGIAPKILKKIKDGGFMRAFLAKGRFSRVLSSIPVRIILEEKTALRGAGAHALRHV